jgi:hypothetical protein
MAPKRTTTEPATGHLDLVIEIERELRALGLEPVLIGGMALVLLGSRRVTRDFDFVMSEPGQRLVDVLDVFYDRGMELAAKLNEVGDVIATIRNRRIAAARLRLDKSRSAFFHGRLTGLRIDVLFDFPLAARDLSTRSLPARTAAGVLRVASESDLLELKRIARSNRSLAADAQDIAFLESRRNIPRDQVKCDASTRRAPSR